MPTRRSSDYQELINQYNTKAEGISKWVDMFKAPLQQNYNSLQQNYNSTVDGVRQQSRVDISNAFANYKNSLLQTEMATNIGTGMRDVITSGLQDSMTNSMSAIKANEVNLLGTAFNNYNKDVNTLDSRVQSSIKSSADNLKKLEEAVYKFNNIDYNTLKSENYYDANTDGTYSINDKSKELFDKTFNEGDSFINFLQGEDQDLFEFFQDNKNMARELIGGLDPTDDKYSKEERYFGMDTKKQIQQLATATIDGGGNVSDRYKGVENMEFESEEAKNKYISQLAQEVKTRPNYVASNSDYKVQDSYNMRGESTVNNTKTKTVNLNGKDIQFKVGQRIDITNPGRDFEQIELHNLQKDLHKVVKSNKLQLGDVFQYNGKYYQYSEFSGISDRSRYTRKNFVELKKVGE